MVVGPKQVIREAILSSHKMPEQFASEYAVDPAAGYDASKLKDKSVVVTGGKYSNALCEKSHTEQFQGASGLGEEMARQFVKAGFGDLLLHFVFIVVLTQREVPSLRSETCQARMLVKSSQNSASRFFPHCDCKKLLAYAVLRQNATYAECNVNTWSDQVNLFKTAISKSPTKSVDIVIANAGISGPDTVWRDGAS